MEAEQQGRESCEDQCSMLGRRSKSWNPQMETEKERCGRWRRPEQAGGEEYVGGVKVVCYQVGDRRVAEC